MTNSSVSFQGFTQQNDTCDTSKLSHRRGSPQFVGMPWEHVELNPLFIGIKRGGGTPF